MSQLDAVPIGHHGHVADEGIAPPSRSTVVERLTEALIDAVVDGRLPVGAPLPPERELAERLEVNRATLRQAVARLEQIGLLTRRQGSGTVVRDPATVSAPGVVARMGHRDRIALVADLLEVREALAGVIGRRAGARLTGDHLDQLRGLCDHIEGATDARTRQALELAFFGLLVEVGGNRAIEAMVRWVGEVYAELDAGSHGGALPSFAGAFEDGHAVASRLRDVLAVAEADGDLASALTAYAAATGELLLDAARR